MQTVYDWVTVGIFAGLIVLFLQRSAADKPAEDKLLHYLVIAVGCAVINYLGNAGYHIAAILLIGGVLGLIVFLLKPFSSVS